MHLVVSVCPSVRLGVPRAHYVRVGDKSPESVCLSVRPSVCLSVCALT